MKTKTIRFIKDLNHNGTLYQRDAVTELPAEQAVWLIDLGYCVTESGKPKAESRKPEPAISKP